MSPPSDTKVPQDVVFDLLSSDRRRFVLQHLHHRDGEAQLDEIALAMAASEGDTPKSDVSSKARKRAYISLYQTHIPRMTEHGVLEYDNDSGTVRLTDTAGYVLEYIDSTCEDTSRWPAIYLGASLVGFLIVLAYYFEIARPIAPIGLAILVCTLVFSIAAMHYLVIETELTIFR